MERKMFGHRLKKRPPEERDPGLPPNFSRYQSDDDYNEKAEDAPPGYEGKEHVKYKNPGYSSHDIRIPEDEPHMKSHVSRDESHEAEDDYHMGVPNQTEDELPRKIPRAHMLMDAPNQEDPKPLRGNIVHNVDYEGEEDESGEEEMGPNDMQEPTHMPKEMRKKMIVAIMKKKMKDPKEPREEEFEGHEEEKVKKKFDRSRY
jgi:hypothetical protein